MCVTCVKVGIHLSQGCAIVNDYFIFVDQSGHTQ